MSALSCLSRHLCLPITKCCIRKMCQTVTTGHKLILLIFFFFFFFSSSSGSCVALAPLLMCAEAPNGFLWLAEPPDERVDTVQARLFATELRPSRTATLRPTSKMAAWEHVCHCARRSLAAILDVIQQTCCRCLRCWKYLPEFGPLTFHFIIKKNKNNSFPERMVRMNGLSFKSFVLLSVGKLRLSCL